MKLETQLEMLAGLGLSLNKGITIDDLLYSFKRESKRQRYSPHVFVDNETMS